MNNEEIDNLFKSRLSNHKSKTNIDKDALWANINNNIEEPKQGFMQKTSRKWLIVSIGVVFLAASIYFIYSCFFKSDNPTSMHKNNEVDYHSEQYNHVNSSTSKTVVDQSKKAKNNVNEKKKILPAKQHELTTIQDVTPELNVHDSKPNTNQTTEMNGGEKVQIVNNIIGSDSIINQSNEIKQTAKRVTVVKKHIIQTDTVIKVRRVRK